ncbi:MAG: DUF4230 domain-containing protein [Prevotella sp.]|nr:DUF4230 domain-containing protein [Prevotella sp.]
MKEIIYFILLCFVLSLQGCKGDDKSGEVLIESEEPIDTMSLMVTRMQGCSRLYTTEYRIHKIITSKDTARLKGSIMRKDYDIVLPFTDRKVAIPMDATVKSYVDFGNFTEKNIRRNGGRIEVTLPDPRFALTSTRIDHKGVRRNVSILRSEYSDEELMALERQGRESILRSKVNKDMIEQVRVNTARVLIPMIRQLGFAEDSITVTFRKDIDKTDINKLIEQKTEKNG